MGAEIQGRISRPIPPDTHVSGDQEGIAVVAALLVQNRRVQPFNLSSLQEEHQYGYRLCEMVQ